jgi:hypothetical protein
MKMLGLQLLAAASMAEASSVRHRQTFDYGWRFHFGDEPGGGPGPYPGTCSFPIDISTACGGVHWPGARPQPLLVTRLHDGVLL